PVNRVARLESAANGGQILMTAATERIVREQLPAEATIRDLGENRLKDLRYAEHIFQILAPGMPDVTGELRTGGAVRVENPAALDLPPGAEPILSRLFNAARRVVIEGELAGGFSGSRVFKVTPYDADGKPELAAVVKLAPAGLVTREYEAYQSRIRGKLSGIPEIWGRPAYAEGGRRAGIRYALVGGEQFDIESLRRYWGRAELADLVHVLESRLFVHLGALWRQSEPRTLRLADSYDRLLPVNVVVRPIGPTGESDGGSDAAIGDSNPDAIALTPETVAAAAPRLGQRVTLSGFVVEAIDPESNALTLNLPEAAEAGGRAWRLRLEQVPDLRRWRVGDLVASPIAGEVTATRAESMARALGEALGASIDLAAETLHRPPAAAGAALSADVSAAMPVAPPAAQPAAQPDATLPNPLLALPRLLAAERDLRVGIVHGDLNLENVLVDPEARTVHLIDFAQSREDHVLHDLLRLEAGVLTRLLPAALAEAGRPPQAAADLLTTLHAAPGRGPDEAALRPIHVGLVAIRRAAATLLSRPGDWVEYHVGLAAYLLGASKYRNLSPEAKQVAFWAAAGATGLAESAPPGNALALGSAMATLLERVPALEAFRRGRIAEWSGPRYELDDRYVGLELLIDQGEEAAQGRWQSQEERYKSLEALLEGVADPALVLLGAPGSGKSTILRHLELTVAMEGLRGADVPLTFFIQLNQYRPGRPGDPPPDPGEWLNERWQARYPDLPALDELLAEGRILLLLDALNEMQAESLTGFRKRVALWKDWLVRLTSERPGNRVVFSCRSLDYSQPLSTPELRVPQVRIEPMDDAAVQGFLRAYVPDRFEAVWDRLAGSRQLEVVRSPYFLKLLVDQVDATGEVPTGRSGLFTGFVRQALRREIERGSPLFEPGVLLTSRDLRRVTGWKWQGAHDLPERGLLLPKLAQLARAMQTGQDDGEGSQVRIDLDDALELLDSEADETILAAGQALAVLDEDQAADELMYIHQLVQEYFAARELAKKPDPELVRVEWRAARIRPSVAEVIDSLDPADPLPPLPQTGWEETTLLAVAMAEDPASYLRSVMETNLALAGRAAVQAELIPLLPADLLDELRWALVKRSRDPEADLRDRIACGYAVGDLGDPRFERRNGPHGEYLLPPLVEIPGGTYPIGDDEPIADFSRTWTDHMPRHQVQVASFAIGQFAVTNAEWACFQESGGYEDERWWDTEAARGWRRGENTAADIHASFRWFVARCRKRPEIMDEMLAAGTWNEQMYERGQKRLAMSAEALDAHLVELYPGGQHTEPALWHDARFNRPAQPVVGICWYEARAYLRWISEQSGLAFRLPTEVEWEAAARGAAGRRFAYGDAFDHLRGNSVETHIRQTTPVGVFPDGDTPEGAADLTGNVIDWTSSAFGQDYDDTEFPYPYDADDGREVSEAAADMMRVLRGASWRNVRANSLAPARYTCSLASRDPTNGVRVVVVGSASLSSTGSGC
ncbi:MAG: SUMF1/EgtB/PvdO family nonheme iron enzyme, partial [Chloroflexi bacterium]|nr:SUMF1/EgtB/PvdO family nonheme iron enzyme [Chloroflexota bacterium]